MELAEGVERPNVQLETTLQDTSPLQRKGTVESVAFQSEHVSPAMLFSIEVVYVSLANSNCSQMCLVLDLRNA